jgi:flagellar hook-associated protein 2
LSGSTLGVPGLTITATTATTQTVTVAANTGAMQTAIQNFAGQYNTVQSYISQQTGFTTNADGTVTPGTLASEQDLQSWASNLQSKIFATVPGLSGSVKQLSNLGIDFDSTGQMVIKDATTLENALSNNSADVAAYFSQNSTGIASSVNSYLTGLLLPSAGSLAIMNNALVSSDKDLASQVTTLQTRLTQEQNNLTNAFESMQAAQTTAQSQLNYLNAAANLQKSGS